MSSNRIPLSELTDAFLAGELSRESGEELLRRVLEDDESSRLFCSNVLCDFYLGQYYRKERSVEEGIRVAVGLDGGIISVPAPAGETDDLEMKGGMEPSWERLVELQNAEKPFGISDVLWQRVTSEGFLNEAQAAVYRQQLKGRKEWTPSNPVLRLLQKCFWPSRKDLKESIAPVVTLFLALALIGAMLSWSFTLRPSEQMRARSPVATITDLVNVVWQPDTEDYRVGQRVGVSRFRLSQGFVKLKMDNGTTLILEGPSDLTVKSEMTSFCEFGKVSVSVSKEGIGYELGTSCGRVTDRGTEFFVEVSASMTQVEVIKGRVDFCSPRHEIVALKAEQLLQYDSTGRLICQDRSGTSDFIDDTIFNEVVQGRIERIRDRKNSINEMIDRSRYLVARMDFGNSSPLVAGKLLRAGAIAPDITVENCRISSGRHFGEKAIQIEGRDSFIAVPLSGSYRSLTILMQVRIDGLNHAANVLCCSESFEEKKEGGVQCLVTREGELYTYVSGGGKNSLFKSPFPVVNNALGSWHEVGIVFSEEEQTVSQYVDGELVSQQLWKNPVAVTLKTLVFGNCREKTDSQNERNLSGALAGVCVFSEAMGREEMRRLYLE